MYTADGSVEISHNTITGNTTRCHERGGGGLYLGSDWGRVLISHNVITSNRASTGAGVALETAYTATLSFNSIVSNTAALLHGGGGVAMLDDHYIVGPSRALLVNNNLYANLAGPALAPNDLTSGGADLKAEDNYWGTADPDVIATHIWDFFDDSSLGVVDFVPLLYEPVGRTHTVTLPIVMRSFSDGQ
jgi:hypothetical protein